MKISKNKKMRFFLIFQGSLNPKIRFLAQKLRYPARVQRHRQTHRHDSDYCGHPFGVSGVFPSACQQGSAQLRAIKLQGGITSIRAMICYNCRFGQRLYCTSLVITVLSPPCVHLRVTKLWDKWTGSRDLHLHLRAFDLLTMSSYICL